MTCLRWFVLRCCSGPLSGRGSVVLGGSWCLVLRSGRSQLVVVLPLATHCQGQARITPTHGPGQVLPASRRYWKQRRSCNFSGENSLTALSTYSIFKSLCLHNYAARLRGIASSRTKVQQQFLRQQCKMTRKEMISKIIPISWTLRFIEGMNWQWRFVNWSTCAFRHSAYIFFSIE